MPQQGSAWVVEGGDNVFKIAEQVYGNQRMAFEILKMNGGQTVIHPGDVLSLPEWNDPNVYVGANQMQNVLNQNAQNPNYKGPTVAAVPDSQAGGFGGMPSLTGQGQGPTGSTAVQGPNIPNNPYLTQQTFRNADAASMTGRKPNLPNASLTQMRGPQPFATPGMTKPVVNTEVARAQRYQSSGVPGSALATQPTQRTGLSTSPMAMAGGNIGNLFSSSTNKNINPELAKKLLNPAYSSAVEAIQNPRGTSGTQATSRTLGVTGANQKFLQQEIEEFKAHMPNGTLPLQSVSAAAASNVLGYNFASIMKSAGYVYDPDTRRFVLTNVSPGPIDKSGLIPAPTSLQAWGEDWNASHHPQAQFEPVRGGNGTGGGVTGRTGSNTVGYAALSTRVATG